MGMNTIVMLENSDGTSGLDKKLKGTGGAAHVRPLPGPQTQSRNRYLSAVDESAPSAVSTNTATWAAGTGVTELTIYTSVTTSTPNYLMVAFNAGSAAIADTWLTATSSGTDDAQWYMIPLKDTESSGPTVFRFTSEVTRVDFKLSGGTTPEAQVWIGAN